MKILVIDMDYPAFIEDMYARQPGLSSLDYLEQLSSRRNSFFGIASYYSNNLNKLGCTACEVYPNNLFMQIRWELENSSSNYIKRFAKESILNLNSFIYRHKNWHLLRYPKTLCNLLFGINDLLNNILKRQIDHFQPDVIINQSAGLIDDTVFSNLAFKPGLLIGQVASPLKRFSSYRNCDLMLSSLPNLVSYFRKQNINSELLRLGFEKDIISRLDNVKKDIDISFVGMLSRDHLQRIELLEGLSRKLPISIWGLGIESISRDSPIHSVYQGKALGMDMYRILNRSAMTINMHSRVADNFANNLRLYEATGSGACLLTDNKSNLNELFEDKKEIISYDSIEDCVEKAEYYLSRPEVMADIARAGQQKTVREHNYTIRMRELLDIVERYVYA